MPLLPDTPAGVRADANSYLDDMVTNIATKQTDYHTANSEYWQGLPTHSVIPVDDSDNAPDQLGGSVTGHTSWTTFGVTVPGVSNISFRVNAYISPIGEGYQVVGEIVLGTDTYTRGVNVGADSSFTTDGWLKNLNDPNAP